MKLSFVPPHFIFQCRVNKSEETERAELHRPSSNVIPWTGLFLSMWNAEPVERVRRRAGSETDRVWETEEIYLKHFVELTLYGYRNDCTKNTDVH